MITECFNCPNPALASVRSYALAADVVLGLFDNEWDLCAVCVGPRSLYLVRIGMDVVVRGLPVPAER